MFGTPNGVLSQPRHVGGGLVSTAASISYIFMGYKDEFGGSVGNVYWIRRPGFTGELYNVAANATNGIILLGTSLALSKLIPTSLNTATVNSPATILGRDVNTTITAAFSTLTGNVEVRNIHAAFDRANGAVADAGGGQATFQLADSTTIDAYSVISSVNAAGTGFLAQPFPNDFALLRVRDYNFNNINSPGGESGTFEYGTIGVGQASPIILRFINCYFSVAKWRKVFGSPDVPLLESAITLNLQVINEIGTPIEGARVIMVNNVGTEIFDVTTNQVGRIPLQEVITHQYGISTAPGGIWDEIWRPPDTPPAPVTEADFSPFELIVLPTASADGYVPSKLEFSSVPFMSTEAKEFVIVLNVPRPDGQFGDAGFDQF